LQSVRGRQLQQQQINAWQQIDEQQQINADQADEINQSDMRKELIQMTTNETNLL
jgi:hypothetical protein